MIRLYMDKEFEVGGIVALPADEVRYYRSVRRGKGEVCLFNRSGQEALGLVDGTEFRIQEIREIQLPVFPVTVAVAWPDSKVVPVIARSLSELGVERLWFFKSERSQNFDRKFSEGRLEKLAIEACRQSSRPRPLQIETIEFEEKNEKDFSRRIFLDESASDSSIKKEIADSASVLVVVGPEGGWSLRERDMARQRGFQFCHFRTPVLRVETAALCGAFFALENYFGVAS